MATELRSYLLRWFNIAVVSRIQNKVVVKLITTPGGHGSYEYSLMSLIEMHMITDLTSFMIIISIVIIQ